MKVAVLGAAGFIGSHLCRQLLEEGARVDLFDDFSRGVRDRALEEIAGQPQARVIERSLLADAGWEDLDRDYSHVVHLAAIVGVAHVTSRPFEVLRDNHAMTLKALAFAAKQSTLRRFVFASTSEVYAGSLRHHGLPVPTPETVPLTLTDLDDPRTSYMLSKLYGEALCRHSGLPVTCVRPHNFYGPRMGLAHVIPELLKRAHAAPAGGRLEVFSPDHRRTFCFIEDAVAWLAALMDHPEAAGGTYNLGTSRPEVTMRELAQLVVRTVGRELEVVDGGVTPGSPERRCPDVSRVEKLTGRRAEVSLEEGLQRTWAWYRDEVFAGGGPSAL